jgi:putative salt-induced outer membrane protein YdiY
MKYALILITFLYASLAQAATITLQNGDTLTAQIIARTDDSLIILHPILGELPLNASDVKDIEGLSTSEGDEKTEGEARETLEQWSGRVRIGANIIDGTTKSESYILEGKLGYEQDDNRYSAETQYNYALAGQQKTIDNLNLRGQYDRFISEKWYAFTNASYFTDDIVAIDSRISGGLGMGYQFFATPRRSLKIEFGLSQVYESRRDDEISYLSPRWNIEYEEHLWKDKLILFHNQEGFLNLNEQENVTIRSRNGLRLPILRDIYTLLQVNVDFDGNPPPAIKALNTRYILGIGYSW